MSPTQLILTRVIEAYGQCLAFQADIETHFIRRRLKLSGEDTPEGLSMLMKASFHRRSNLVIDFFGIGVDSTWHPLGRYDWQGGGLATVSLMNAATFTVPADAQVAGFPPVISHLLHGHASYITARAKRLRCCDTDTRDFKPEELFKVKTTLKGFGGAMMWIRRKDYAIARVAHFLPADAPTSCSTLQQRTNAPSSFASECLDRTIVDFRFRNVVLEVEQGTKGSGGWHCRP